MAAESILAIFFCSTSATASAANLLGAYVGVGVGQSTIALDGFPGASSSTNLSEHATGLKALAGLRPLPWIGAELEYVDLGHSDTRLPARATDTASGVPAAVKANGPAVFGVAYLPLPLFDVYGKVGVSRVRTIGDAAAGIVGVDTCYFFPATLGCRPFHDDRQATGLSWGGGVQLKLSSFGLRAEFERFGSGSARPSLASIIVSWRF